MRLIFLDIDGVLVPYPLAHDAERVCQDILPDTDGCPAFAPQCVSELNWICESSGATIVISSTWRQHIPSLGTMRSVLGSQGVTATIVGMTPIAGGDWDRHDRGDEVAHYLAPLDVESFVVLDDFDMGWDGLEQFWVRPRGTVGLQRSDAEKAVEILCRND